MLCRPQGHTQPQQQCICSFQRCHCLRGRVPCFRTRAPLLLEGQEQQLEPSSPSTTTCGECSACCAGRKATHTRSFLTSTRGLDINGFATSGLGERGYPQRALGERQHDLPTGRASGAATETSRHTTHARREGALGDITTFFTPTRDEVQRWPTCMLEGCMTVIWLRLPYDKHPMPMPGHWTADNRSRSLSDDSSSTVERATFRRDGRSRPLPEDSSRSAPRRPRRRFLTSTRGLKLNGFATSFNRSRPLSEDSISTVEKCDLPSRRPFSTSTRGLESHGSATTATPFLDLFTRTQAQRLRDFFHTVLDLYLRIRVRRLRSATFRRDGCSRPLPEDSSHTAPRRPRHRFLTSTRGLELNGFATSGLGERGYP